ncbi:hypothetical protein N657DRAFT_573304 [Parathielavia appendiculata]|uniref:Zn(2)-C6 fungal-type domain-containing protein n=1 Tax=Parathielavia appendiculata TaxID=2587402 RepID=A0AAN6U0F7_9PEZI|nr:hypothetical protein N657DRAFT_573304 [Parathielavia appendiculata]
MVYCGKPSKGCSNCRERKIRCDQREPGCGQCEKRQQKCPGYRNLVDLMFRDESSHVIKKAKARARKKANNLGISRPATPSDSEGRLSVTPEPRSRPLSVIVPPTPLSMDSASRDSEQPDDTLMSPESGNWPMTPPMAQLYSLAPTCQEDGFAYFFSRYVTAEEMPSHQRFDFLPDVWKPSSSAANAQIDGVLASMTAVGLMGLASTSQSPCLMDAARKSYGTALRLINHALQDPAEAVKDSTMLSILILGVFEMMAENTQRTMTVETFQEHVKGAEALAVMRGPAQFKTRAGRRMFSMLCQRVIISCVQRNEPMPDSLIELWHQMCQSAEAENPSRRFMPLLFQVLQVRSEIHSGFLSDPETIVDRLLAIDQQLENLTNQLPPSWKHRAFEVKMYHPAVFGGICHLYASHHHANVWNHILTTRILLLETVLCKISQDLASFCPILDSARYLEEYRKARRKLKHMVRDIVASVPQQLGLMNPTDGSIGSADGDSAPISTVEIRETPSPPTSPSSRSSDSASAVYSPLSVTAEPPRGGQPPLHHHHHHSSGLTILDVTKACDAGEDEAERYMLLVSATRSVVWPLFVVGMSTACTADMRAYVVERLRTLYMETGIRQADAVARLLEEHEMVGSGGVLEEPEESGAEAGAGASWLDMQLKGAGQHQEMPAMAHDYGLGLLHPMTVPEVKLEFDMAWV